MSGSIDIAGNVFHRTVFVTYIGHSSRDFKVLLRYIAK